MSNNLFQYLKDRIKNEQGFERRKKIVVVIGTV